MANSENHEVFGHNFAWVSSIYVFEKEKSQHPFRYLQSIDGETANRRYHIWFQIYNQDLKIFYSCSRYICTLGWDVFTSLTWENIIYLLNGKSLISAAWQAIKLSLILTQIDINNCSKWWAACSVYLLNICNCWCLPKWRSLKTVTEAYNSRRQYQLDFQGSPGPFCHLVGSHDRT